ncbi:MAG: phenylalanine--tRNA ligase subunit beta [Bacteroidales bacterium]|jgi:phenylalanyl-tRNA synthetase beta chain|nr:phenylalanine--tRNA ligase subunit beta [Bacteroidales bacterium]
MKISYNWLKEFVKIDLKAEAVSKILTDIGLEVESCELHESIKGGLKGIVVGKVLTCERHPNADKLSVTTVNIGNDTILPIVCGAPNVSAGQTVLVATEGTILYAPNGEEFEIKKAKIRGEVSQGMICAEDEIGLGSSHEGIMVLPDSVPAGTLASTYFNVTSDYVFEIGLTPNRIDAASHFGVARDLCAYLNLSGNHVVKKPSIDAFSAVHATNDLLVSVENSKLCPRYAGIVISGVKVSESPDWLKQRLIAIGQKPINNVVDITNYVLHELGQPLHAFDLEQIDGKKIIVKTVANGTRFTTLDGVVRTLSAEDLMICSATKPLCIAGVFGGLHSGVTEKTTDIFLESAYFNPVSVRKTARRHGLNTDASFRFERGIDPNQTTYILKRAALLIQKVAGGSIVEPLFDTHPDSFPPFAVELSIAKIQTVIGKKIDKTVIQKILDSLEMKIALVNGDKLTVHVPPYRVDVQRQEDVIEDILRIYGYNNIELPQALHASIVYADAADNTKQKNAIAELLVANGACEIMNNSLSRSAYYTTLMPEKQEEIVKILNPLSAELDSMRASLLFGVLEVVQYNSNRQLSDFSVFEFGNVYSKPNNGAKGIAQYAESQHLALCSVGKQNPQFWAEKQKDVDIYALKSQVHKICALLGYTAAFEPFQSDTLQGLQCVVNGVVVAQLGILSAKIRKHFDIEKPCVYAEMYWNTLLAQPKPAIRHAELPQYPEVRRDLSLLIHKSVTYADIEKLAFATDKKILKHVSAFDVYEGKGVPEGKKSYAVSFTLQDKEQTLTDKQIDVLMQKLIHRFTHELGAELR